jgi:hypothetical protein
MDSGRTPRKPAPLPTRDAPAGGASPLEELPWDSEFFGVRIARADLVSHELSAIVADAAARGVDCLYLSAAGEQVREVEEAVRRGARIAEFRTSWHLDLRRLSREPPEGTRLAIPEDAPALVSLAGRLAPLSRFSADPRFPARAVERMYELQMERCLRAGTVAVPTAGPAGVCAVLADGRVAYVHLIYTDRSVRHAALGSRLVVTALQAVDASRAACSTRASNLAVLRICAALGGRMRRFRVVMHLWLDELA